MDEIKEELNKLNDFIRLLNDIIDHQEAMDISSNVVATLLNSLKTKVASLKL